MKRWILAVLLALMQVATSTASFGQQDLDQEPAFTRDQWQERVEKARRQSERFVTSVRAEQRDALSAEESFPDAELTREQWQQRIEDARRRTEDFVASAGTADSSDPLPRNLQEREASERAMNDPTLQVGDIVSTERGLVVFLGRTEERQPGAARQ
jgi:hypothetical protein